MEEAGRERDRAVPAEDLGVATKVRSNVSLPLPIYCFSVHVSEEIADWGFGGVISYYAPGL
jgi:hypothetical protein